MDLSGISGWKTRREMLQAATAAGGAPRGARVGGAGRRTGKCGARRIHTAGAKGAPAPTVDDPLAMTPITSMKPADNLTISGPGGTWWYRLARRQSHDRDDFVQPVQAKLQEILAASVTRR